MAAGASLVGTRLGDGRSTSRAGVWLRAPGLTRDRLVYRSGQRAFTPGDGEAWVSVLGRFRASSHRARESPAPACAVSLIESGVDGRRLAIFQPDAGRLCCS